MVHGDFKRPYLKLIFKPTGELKSWTAAAGGTMLGRRAAARPGTKAAGRTGDWQSQPAE